MAANAESKKHLRRGNPGNKGGGRPHNWIIDKCKDIVDKRKIIEFLADVAEGKPIEEVPNPLFIPGRDNGEKKIIKVPASVKDRIAAARELLDRGFGKPAQTLEHSGPDGSDIPYSIEIKTVTANGK